jgi:lipopolysaccharide/colanic/teichoic acid biosynthesis glycosyltransferase
MNLLTKSIMEKALAAPGNLMKLMDHSPDNDPPFYNETYFRHMLRVERMRTERSKKHFLLLLVDISEVMVKNHQEETLANIKAALLPSLREVDVRGWYHNDHTIGIIFTEIQEGPDNFTDIIIRKIYDRLSQQLDPDIIKRISISFHLFPESHGNMALDEPFNIFLYPDLTRKSIGRNIPFGVKKVIDLVGSATALLLFAPLFIAIALAVKLTSPGPVFFKQERVGLNGKIFPMLKFRSMETNCDSKKHQDYVKKFINDQKNCATEPGVFKLTNDSRITKVGSFIRKTSLDELPQFINVLKGDMSLVGPRPPIPYECALYDIWHRRRLLSCKPGITGLWQVLGRSRTTFDEMVRLDLKYIREWCLWLDIKILLMTPKAVIDGTGAL